jgi:hypothetical protein
MEKLQRKEKKVKRPEPPRYWTRDEKFLKSNSLHIQEELLTKKSILGQTNFGKKV